MSILFIAVQLLFMWHVSIARAAFFYNMIRFSVHILATVYFSLL